MAVKCIQVPAALLADAEAVQAQAKLEGGVTATVFVLPVQVDGQILYVYHDHKIAGRSPAYARTLYGADRDVPASARLSPEAFATWVQRAGGGLAAVTRRAVRKDGTVLAGPLPEGWSLGGREQKAAGSPVVPMTGIAKAATAAFAQSSAKAKAKGPVGPVGPVAEEPEKAEEPKLTKAQALKLLAQLLGE